VRTALAIAAKELRIYGTTWISYIVLAAFLEINAFLFHLLVREFQVLRLRYAEARTVALLNQMNLTDLVVGPTFSYVATFFVFLLPVLTMRSFAEERRSKTLELMYSTPLRSLELVAGKYAAAWLMMALMLATTVVFPLSLDVLAAAEDPNALDWRTVGCGYFGMLLLGSLGVAVGLLASAVTDSQVVAVTLAFAALLLLLVVGVAAPAQTGVWRTVLEQLSISHHMQGFTRGLLRANDVTYYVSATFLALYFTHRALDAERWR
jgi:ABC-2 type transport system permease protein